MRLAIISDIHGNLAAFQAVLADMDRCGVDACVSLGDNIGYGPDPEAVVALIQDRGISSVLGNHEVGLIDPSRLAWFNHLARNALMLTRDAMSEAAVDYCRTLPWRLEIGGCWCVHGAPPEDAFVYIFELPKFALKSVFSELSRDICFVGHTHMLELISRGNRRIKRRPLADETVTLEDDHQYIVNVGSVGQPRDFCNRDAKYVIYDDEKHLLEVRFTAYPRQETAQKILDLGWPEFLAHRLL
jgi:predicted phosphodiesterase